MLRVLGSPKKFCDGVTRRDLMRIGGLGLAGLSLPQITRLQEASANDAGAHPPGFGKAKSVILIHLYGSPSQLEWCDQKPNAPVEIRGEFGSIPSSLPGCLVCDLMPNFAKVTDRCTILRSLTHPYPIHGVAFALTGIPVIDVQMELAPHDPRHWPFFGSTVEFVDRRSKGPSSALASIPPNMALPWKMSSRRKGEVSRAGPYASFLGSEYDPLWVEFQGEANKGYIKTLNTMKYTDNDPYVGIADGGRFVVPSAMRDESELSLNRLNHRKSLLAQFNDIRPQLVSSKSGKAYDKHQQSALSLLESPKLAESLEVSRESEATRAMYGKTVFGQSLLAARRLVEAGTRVATVFWDEFGLAGSGWDTHWDHFGRMKNELCPGFDQGFYGLITDLDQRGLLDETLVVCTSEHGRTPSIASVPGGGRDHWSRVYTSVIAGGGTKRGMIVGASDAKGGDVAERPISPKDLLATMYHLLGIDHHQLVHDRAGRPHPLVEAEVIHEAIA